MSLSPIQGTKLDHQTKQGANRGSVSGANGNPSQTTTLEEKADSVSQKCFDDLNLAQKGSPAKDNNYEMYASDDDYEMFASPLPPPKKDSAYEMFVPDDEFVPYASFLPPPKPTQGSIHYLNGNVYKGETRNGKAHGQGELIYACGNTYTGEFKDDLPNGKGIFQEKDGNRYEGQLQNGKAHGQGKSIDKNGGVYLGEFKNGRRSGKGFFKEKDGTGYEGEFKDDLLNGKGIMAWKDGAWYEGEFKNGIPYSKGRFTDQFGNSFEGTFKNRRLHGDIIVTYKNEAPKTIKYNNGCRIDCDSSEIGSSYFFRLTFGLPLDRCQDGSHLWIYTDFLNRNGYQKYAPEFMELYEQFQLSSEEFGEEAKRIHKRVIDDHQSKLLLYGTTRHAMLLNLVPDPNDANFIICEIFNSGEGLETMHPRKIVRGKLKYQTMLQVRIPAASLTPEKIQLFLESPFEATNEATKDAYNAILGLEGAKILEQAPGKEIWKAPQKGPICLKGCLDTYGRHKMPEYYRMRYEMSAECLEEAQNNFSTEADIKLFETYSPPAFYKTIKKLRKLDIGT